MNGQSTESSTYKEVIEILKKVAVGEDVNLTVVTAAVSSFRIDSLFQVGIPSIETQEASASSKSAIKIEIKVGSVQITDASIFLLRLSYKIHLQPWDDETDMAKLEESVRSIQADGLFWGASKLVANGYGIKKLQISCEIDRSAITVDDIIQKIEALDENIQSVEEVPAN